MSITKTLFDRTEGGREVYAYVITAKHGASLKLLEYGGIMQSLLLPDKNGKVQDVICGFDSLEGYRTGGGYQGALIGRYGNRIKDGKFTLNGKEYVLNRNENGVTHLHGGSEGFNCKIWSAEVLSDNAVRFSLFSPDGDEGYPGNLSVSVTYTFDESELSIVYEATTDADTPCNLTSHTYYNLNGYDGGSVMQQMLWLNSDLYNDIDEQMIPVGAPASVKNSRFDFTVLKPISTPLDHNFVLRGKPREMKKAAMYYDPASARTITLYTDMPAVQIYTGCVMDGKVPFKKGVPQRPLHAMAMETQFSPNTPNRPDFPSCILHKGETFRSQTRLEFGIAKTKND